MRKISLTESAQINLAIQGIHCASCVSRIEGAFSGVPGISAANVNFATGHAAIAYDPSLVDPGAIREIIQDAGYQVIRRWVLKQAELQRGEGG